MVALGFVTGESADERVRRENAMSWGVSFIVMVVKAVGC